MQPDLKENLGNPITKPISAMPVANAERRQTVIRVMTDLFVFDEGNMTEKERTLHGEVLAGLVGEAGLVMRSEVAERLATVRYAPKKVVLSLAKDDISAAHTILAHSPALSNEDLVDIAQTETIDHRIAIAGRPRLESSLVSALIISGEDAVFEAIARNSGAILNEATLSRIAARSLNNAGLAEALTTREDLNADVLSGLFWTASPAMREKIMDLVSPAAGSGARLAHAPIRISSEIEQLSAQEGLASLLISRKIKDFQRIMSQLLSVSNVLIERIMADPEGEPFAVACKAMGFSSETFTTLLLLYNPTVSESIKRVFALNELYDRITSGSSWYFLEIWNNEMRAKNAVENTQLKPAIHDQLTGRSVSNQRQQFEQKVAKEMVTISTAAEQGRRQTSFGRRGA